MQAIKLTPPLIPQAVCTLGFLACFRSFLSSSSEAGSNQAIYPWDRVCVTALARAALLTCHGKLELWDRLTVDIFTQSRGEMEMDIG